MVVTKTEWLSLRLHSEAIYNLVSSLEVANLGIWQESQLVLDMESQITSMLTLTQLLRGVIQMNPRKVDRVELHS